MADGWAQRGRCDGTVALGAGGVLLQVIVHSEDDGDRAVDLVVGEVAVECAWLVVNVSGKESCQGVAIDGSFTVAPPVAAAAATATVGKGRSAVPAAATGFGTLRVKLEMLLPVATNVTPGIVTKVADGDLVDMKELAGPWLVFFGRHTLSWAAAGYRSSSTA